MRSDLLALAGAGGRRSIRTNGTVTFIQSEKKVFGVTAAHVIRGYLAEADRETCVLQVGLGTQHHSLDLIAVDDELDLATFEVTERVIATMGKEITPVSLPRPGDVPQEGRGILIAGVRPSRLADPSLDLAQGTDISCVGIELERHRAGVAPAQHRPA